MLFWKKRKSHDDVLNESLFQFGLFLDELTRGYDAGNPCPEITSIWENFLSREDLEACYIRNGKSLRTKKHNFFWAIGQNFQTVLKIAAPKDIVSIVETSCRSEIFKTALNEMTPGTRSDIISQFCAELPRLSPSQKTSLFGVLDRSGLLVLLLKPAGATPTCYLTSQLMAGIETSKAIVILRSSPSWRQLRSVDYLPTELNHVDPRLLDSLYD